MRHRRGIPFLVFLLHAAASHAADGPDPALPTVEVRGPAYDERREDTASKTVVTHADIVRYGDTNLVDALKRLPGISAAGAGIQLRGLGAAYVQILLNGEPAPPGFALDGVSPDSVEKIEIVRAATAEYGTRAIAGTINIVLKRVLERPQQEIKTGLSGDAGARSRFANFQLSDRLGTLSYALGGAVGHNAYTRRGEDLASTFDAIGATGLTRGERRDGGDSDSFQLTPRLNWKAGAADIVIAQSFARYGRGASAGAETEVTEFGPTPTYPVNGHANRTVGGLVNTSVNWIHDAADGAKLDLKLGLNWSERHNRSAFNGGDGAASAALRRDSRATTGETGLTFSAKYTASAAQGHALLIGADGGASRRDDSRQQTDTMALSTIRLDDDFDIAIGRLAVFAQDEWNLTPAWSLYTGLRWEGISTSSEGVGLERGGKRSSVLSPILQTLWKLPGAPGTQMRAALARTYKSPPVGGLIMRRTLSTDNNALQPDYQGNPDLRPELAWGLDAAIEHFGDAGAVFSASAYARRIGDLTEQGLTRHDDGRWVSMPANQGRASAYGLELEAKFPLRGVWRAAPAIDVHLNMARNWSRVADVPGPDNRLPEQAQATANIGFDWSLAHATVGANYNFQGGGMIRSAPDSASASTPTRTLDCYGVWKFDRRTQLRLSVSNILAQDSVSRFLYTDQFGGRSDTSLAPTYRNVRIVLEHKFL